MKLHIGCGPVYLEGYINIDARVDFLLPNAPDDIFEQNKTTYENYYKHEFGKGSSKTIADVESDILNLSFKNGSVDEIVLLHILEHIPQYSLDIVLNKIYNMLKQNGTFIVGVPDLKGFSQMMVGAKTKEEEEWCIRLIHGTQRDKYCHHFCGYTDAILLDLLTKYGFGSFEKLPNINFYPAIHYKAIKE